MEHRRYLDRSGARLGLFGLMGPFAAAFMNRFGVRRVAPCALMLILSGLVGSLWMTQIWQLVLLWGIVVGLGTGLTALVLGATVATQWFSARRGLVVGCLTASTATGQLVFLPLLAQMTETYGWRYALAHVLALLVLAIIAVLTLIQDRPSDLGLAPYGETEVVFPPAQAMPLRTLVTSPLIALRDAGRTRVFWVLFGTFFVCGASTNGLIQTHFVAMCGDFGVAAVGAAGILAVIGIFDFRHRRVGLDVRPVRQPPPPPSWYYGLRGLSLIYLPFTDFTFYGLSFFAVFYGLDWVKACPAADRRAGGAGLRTRARQLCSAGVRRPPARRRDGRLLSRADANAGIDLSSGVLHRGHPVPSPPSRF